MSSGVTKENSITKFVERATPPRHRCKPIANATPSGTAIIAVRSESLTVWSSACWSAGSCSTDESGSHTYQRSDAPCHWVIDRPSLNEKITAWTTGIRIHAT